VAQRRLSLLDRPVLEHVPHVDVRESVLDIRILQRPLGEPAAEGVRPAEPPEFEGAVVTERRFPSVGGPWLMNMASRCGGSCVASAFCTHAP